MTVKGLEPELRNMMEQHAEEIQKLRNLHMKELQDTELRIIRRSNQQLEQLRLELTASHERMLANEKNILWTRCRINFLEKSDWNWLRNKLKSFVPSRLFRYQEKLEEQENQFKTQQAKLVEELQYDRDKFAKEQTKRDTEMEANLQKMHMQYKVEIELKELEKQVYEMYIDILARNRCSEATAFEWEKDTSRVVENWVANLFNRV